MKVPLLDLKAQYQTIRDEIGEAVEEVLLGSLLLRKQRTVIVRAFDFVGMYFLVLLASISPGQITLSL